MIPIENRSGGVLGKEARRRRAAGLRGASVKKISKSTLRWFIGTKSLMPIVEIRRRFGIDGEDVTVLEDNLGKLYVGLPAPVVQVMEDLRRQGKIGYEVSMDLNARVLVGTYAIFGRGRGEPRPDQEAEPSENAA